MSMLLSLICLVLAVTTPVVCADTDASEATEGAAALADRDAMNMYRRGMALMSDRQDDRAVLVLEGILLNYPRSTVRHMAALELGRHFTESGDHEAALKQLNGVLISEDADDDQRAEALFRSGACHYEQGDSVRALTLLRQVTENYPWSSHANDAYYYIGLCHYKAKRWTRAVEAFRMVGTSVEPVSGEFNLAESGHRYMIRVEDKDLRVLALENKDINVIIKTQSGDSETVPLERFDREGETYLGSIPSESGPPLPDDGILQFKGADNVTVTYVDRNTHEGVQNINRQAVSRFVSTATGGFMDGAYREYIKGVFAGQRNFLQVRDYDASITDNPDTLTVRLYSQYRPTEQELGDRGITVRPEDGPYYDLHHETTVTLTETGPHTGIFTAIVTVSEVPDKDSIVQTSPTLQAVDGDFIFMDYIDKAHIDALDAPRTVTANAAFLTGEIPDVWIAQRDIHEPNLRARKHNLEASFYLRLAEIFKSVGLVDRVEQRASIGLEKANAVLQDARRLNLDQKQVEEAYRLKWEMEVVAGNLGEAIRTCRTFMLLFPESQIADLALLQIAKASMEIGDPRQAFALLQGILQLNTTEEIKGEAQFNIARMLELEAEERVRNSPDKKVAEGMMAPTIAAYHRVAELYPGSAFAGESLGKVIDFYLGARNYARCAELLDKVFIDYPDAPFLDEMLLKWGVMLARTGQVPDARSKLQQLLRDYPNSPAAGQAKPLLDRLANM